MAVDGDNGIVGLRLIDWDNSMVVDKNWSGKSDSDISSMWMTQEIPAG